MRVDDALDVLGVHGVGGALGHLAASVSGACSAWAASALSRPALAQFAVQAEGVVAAAVGRPSPLSCIAKARCLDVGLRVDREQETQGLDFASHGETGYNVEQAEEALMKLVIAIIQPHRLDAVRERLHRHRYRRADGDRSARLWPPEGPQRNLSRRGISDRLLPKLKLEVAVPQIGQKM